MKNKKVKTEKIEKIGLNIEEAIEILDELAKFFDDRVSDLYQVKGGAAERHNYIFYRSRVWDAVEKLEENYTKFKLQQ
jgi:hypothetical protein